MAPAHPRTRDRAIGGCPYCRFKDDRGRLRALVSRDIRIVLVTLTLLVAAPAYELGATVRTWIGSALR